MKQLSGVIAILATPFTDDDRLDLPGLERVVEYALGLGVHGVGIGLASEYLSLSDRDDTLPPGTGEISAPSMPGEGNTWTGQSCPGPSYRLADGWAPYVSKSDQENGLSTTRLRARADQVSAGLYADVATLLAER